jgi:hypothetical protein
MSQRVFERHDIHAVFQQMRGIRVSQGMGVNFFDYYSCFLPLVPPLKLPPIARRVVNSDCQNHHLLVNGR